MMIGHMMAVLPLTLLAACSLPTLPATDTGVVAPSSWQHADAAAAVAQEGRSLVGQGWWRSFNSAELDRLMDDAQLRNLDVAAALARLDQADALARSAGASLLPTVEARLDASRDGRLGGHSVTTGSSYAGALVATYEIDVWGRNRAIREAAVQSAQASRFDRDTVRLIVAASVASTSLQISALQERVALAQANVANAARILELVSSRQRAGTVTQLDLAQQRGLLAAARRTAAALVQQHDDARNTLAVLLARPGQTDVEFAALDRLAVPLIDAELPSTLLTRRPDIARAEAQLAAARANLQVARTALLPAVNLTGAVGASNNRLHALFDNPVYSLAAGLTAPIFNAGRLAAERDLAAARQAEMLAGYRATIVAAFGDAEAALNAIAGIDAQRQAQQEELLQAERACRLAESRYRAGADTLLTLLDAQRTLYAAQDLAAQLKQQRLQAAVALFRALGGGWRRQEGEMAG